MKNNRIKTEKLQLDLKSFLDSVSDGSFIGDQEVEINLDNGSILVSAEIGIGTSLVKGEQGYLPLLVFTNSTKGSSYTIRGTFAEETKLQAIIDAARILDIQMVGRNSIPERDELLEDKLYQIV